MKTTVTFAAFLLFAAQLQAQQSPAVQRLREAVAVASSGNIEQMKAFAAKTYAPSFRSIASDDIHASYLAQFAGARLEENRISVSGNRAAAALDNPVTEEVDSLIIVVDNSAEHLISGVGSSNGGPIGARKTYATDEARAAELRRYVKKLADGDKFSGVVLLARNGKVLVHEAYGLANRDFNVPNKLDTKFNLGSANKNFTAVVIAQLVEEGKLSWDDPLSKFVPDFPDSASARKVLIKHLLSHSAGLGSYFNRTFMESSRARYRTVDEMMTLARPDSLRFEPGKRFQYSNTGYLVLGKVIEVVEGKSYFDVVRDRIYKPLGMTSTDSYQLDQVNPNLAVGYTRAPGANGMELRNNIFEHVIRGGPAGGGYSNAPDMLKYDEALRAGKLVKPETLALMRSPKPELGVKSYGYGFALFDGPTIWGHGGDFPGIDFDNNQYGESGYVLIVLANYDRVNGPILRKMKELLGGGPGLAEFTSGRN